MRHIKLQFKIISKYANAAVFFEFHLDPYDALMINNHVKTHEMSCFIVFLSFAVDGKVLMHPRVKHNEGRV